MSADLRLLDEVAWCGVPVPGRRTHALLAALAAESGGTLSEGRLVDDVWGQDDVPAAPAKALQVVVSRARAQTAPNVVLRTDHGYRLGLRPHQVDALLLRDAVTNAREAEGRRDLVRARDLAREALALPAPAPATALAPHDDGPLGELRAAAARHRAIAEGVLGRALSGLGDHAEALTLLAHIASDDEATVAARLRSAAAVHGAAAALEAYEHHRAGLADRLGVDPGPALQALYAELLAADRPVRARVLHDPTPLIGRDDDIRALRAAVRQARVTSILGPGGLGKTRLAHLLGREAEQPVVHFVELVGVAAPEDVVGEVGSALGVRDSVSGRRVLTAEQRANVRARIGQALDQAPTLLILDNCEHVVAAVADLVAFLVATCRRLRVVTTTRAPLAIAAEQIFPLAQLTDETAADLFRQRAAAARPGVTLDDETVRRVARRLDGLPLAIELTAAKVRVMSVADIDRRLDDRFALLRGGDRSAPDRHQTLLAVIDWSWNLLTEAERRALRWLSVFADGFTLAAAGALLGHDALDEVESLVDQSLLTVLDGDDAGSVRYRMLETVREFGRMQLVGAGEDAYARSCWRRPISTSAARLASGSGTLMPPASGVRTGSSPTTRGTTATACAVWAGSSSCSCSVELPTWLLSWSEVPSATLRPRSITAIREASWSASSRYCVVSSTAQPWATRSRMVSHICPRVRGSRPVVGSSRKISGGRAIRLAARSRRRRMPPENAEICLSAASVSPNRASSSSAVLRDRALETPSNRPNR